MSDGEERWVKDIPVTFDPLQGMILLRIISKLSGFLPHPELAAEIIHEAVKEQGAADGVHYTLKIHQTPNLGPEK